MLSEQMMRFAPSIVAALAGLMMTGGAASAHPHVWVTVQSEVVYSADGAVTGVRHAWTFDDMYSTFATQGLESKQKGVFTREELAPLAEVNVTSLKEYDYFNFAKANGKKTPFTDPVDYWLEFKDQMLTLRFTLPLKAPVKAQSLDLEVFDPAYFVDFSFAEKDAAKLVGAPAQCQVTVFRAGDSAPQGQRLSEQSIVPPNPENYGAQFSSKLMVKCP
jgi:ABC-type uncharacterized transport system substrate-binding protein